MVDIQFDNVSTKVLTANIGSHFVCRDVDGGELIGLADHASATAVAAITWRKKLVITPKKGPHGRCVHCDYTQ